MSVVKKLHQVRFFLAAHPRRFELLLLMGVSIGLSLIGAASMPESQHILTRAQVPPPLLSAAGVPTYAWLGGMPCTTPPPTPIPSGGPSGQHTTTVVPTNQPTIEPTSEPTATPTPAPNSFQQLLDQLGKFIQQLLCSLFGTCGSPIPSPAPTALSTTTGIPTSNPTLTEAPSGPPTQEPTRSGTGLCGKVVLQNMPTPQPYRGTLLVYTTDNRLVGTTQTNADGMYQVSVQPGIYIVTVGPLREPVTVTAGGCTSKDFIIYGP